MTEEFSQETRLTVGDAFSMYPGFQFSPTDEDLISYYLQKKMDGSENSIEVIREVDVYNYEPSDLPAKSVIQSKGEWFFFCPRGRKYPSQSRRGTEIGYWKAAGKERNVMSGSIVLGTKRVLVFHIGSSPRGERTEWILHEECTARGFYGGLSSQRFPSPTSHNNTSQHNTTV